MSEPPRVSRRLPPLRVWEHDKEHWGEHASTEASFGRGARASGPPGGGAAAGACDEVGRVPVDCGADRCSPETLWLWVRRAERDAGQRPGVTTNERARLTALEREHRELKRANEILRRASAFFAPAELDRSTQCPMPSCTPSSMRVGRTTGSSRFAEFWRSHLRPTTCTVNAMPMRRATRCGRSATPSCRTTSRASTATTVTSTVCGRSGGSCSATAPVWRAQWRA